MSKLRKLQRKRVLTIVGLMSGTSADGIDAVVARVSGGGSKRFIRELSHSHVRFPNGFQEFLLDNSLPGSGSVDIVCRLNVAIANLFSAAAGKAASKAGISLQSVDLIGCHGQTVHHLPGAKDLFGLPIRSTLQLGDIPTIAARTGVPTVGNFRTADMAVGGQGAPLMPLLDFFLLRSEKLNRVILNLGGIANVTALPRGCSRRDVLAFDTGPANMVVDGLMKRLYRRAFDARGAIAHDGRIDFPLLRFMMSHPYFKLPPPKSTGREVFGEMFERDVLLRTRRMKKRDIIATATEATSLSIYEQYVRFIRKEMRVDELIVSGGGAKNEAIMRGLREKFSTARVRRIEEFGWNSASKEARLCALLAYEFVHERPANLPGVTGARREALLGSLAL